MTSPLPAADALRTELRVDGMHCDNCVRHVRDALAEIPGVSAEVDLASATATVTHPTWVPVRTLLDMVDEAGYEVAVRDAAPQ
jgi:copper chaperone CopZ